MYLKNIFKYLFIWIVLVFCLLMMSIGLFSCRTVKTVTKEKNVYDSAAIKEVQKFQNQIEKSESDYQKLKENYESLKKELDYKLVENKDYELFFSECPEGENKTPSKVSIDDMGNIDVEGNLKTVTIAVKKLSEEKLKLEQDKQQLSTEISKLLSEKIELVQENENLKTQVNILENSTHKKNKRNISIWLLIVCVIAGSVFWIFFGNPIKKIVNGIF